MTAQTLVINLLPKDEFERSFVGKFLKWALTVGRYIVIGTELVVIGSFLARFSLDRQMSDLNEAIAEKKNVLASFAVVEDQARGLQTRLNLIKQLTQEQLDLREAMNLTAQFTPVDVLYTDLTYTRELINIQGVAFSEAGLQTLLETLRGEKSFVGVAVKRVTSAGSQGSGIEFEIEAQKPAAMAERSERPTPSEQVDIERESDVF